MVDKIIIRNTDSETKIGGVQATDVLNGEMLLVREADKERLYCKNSDGEIAKIHRIVDAGNFTSSSVYETVDLGLPSGLLWSNKNIGAETEEDAGLYFQWGDTVGYTAEQVGVEFTEDYKWWNGSGMTKYTQSDGLTTLEASDDTATQLMGSNWRMPTKEELVELIRNTEIYFIPSDASSEIQAVFTGSTNLFTFPKAETMKGMKFYKKGDRSKYIFVPVSGDARRYNLEDANNAGFLWSSSLDNNEHYAIHLSFIAKGGWGNVQTRNTRYIGTPVRGVKSPQ